ncbi:hypothetical protein M3Y99_01587000 [Aphelenchoides fujianensis]|nr:hypothetical protein M3Y99_01587000 [Aphelenchoides fujianensis]
MATDGKEWTEEELNALAYNDIRKALQDGFDPSRGGGLDETRDLGREAGRRPAEAEAGEITDDEEDVPKVEAAGAAPADPDGIPELNADELMDVDDQSTEPLNSTYTKSDSNSQEGSPEEATAEMSADESRPASGLGTAEERPLLESAPRVEVARVDHDRMDYPENSPPVVLTTPLASSTAGTAGQSKIPRFQGPAASSERFAAAHRELFAKMPSIEETLSAKKERQQNLLTDNERINRLATPKAADAAPPSCRVRPRARRSRPNVFEFQATRTQASSEPPVARKVFTPRKPQKENARAQSVIPATIPDCSERINQLATPKGADRAVSIPRERRLFTPKTGRFEYTDTTKMSDAEFAMYMKRERQQDRPPGAAGSGETPALLSSPFHSFVRFFSLRDGPNEH